ncbi:MAG: aspartate/glutamate racemase family protein [Chloroflexi bacterium]|nr:aspartate/glutamate racemase family protein [Chloroflexota bacterium]
MKLLIIRPIISNRKDELEEAIFHPFLSPGTEVEARRLMYGSSSIENEYDAALNTPEIIRLAVNGEKERFDGAIINCFVDPGLEAIREAVSYPVVGAGSASVQLALSVGHRIAIITIVPSILPMIRRLNAAYINTGRIISVRSIDVPVLAIYEDNLIYEKLFAESVKAIKEDGADSIILGCTGFGGIACKIATRLSDNGMVVPVVDPAGASVAVLEGMIRCNIRHSKIGWMSPIEKERRFK